MTSKTWTVPIDPEGNITFPEDLVKAMDWEDGTILLWDIQDDGSISLRAQPPSDSDKAHIE
tara:strand:- start:44 stop:226 length:183 start_codon:yes stop_codon:yes gene_type:complete